jgi:hypothetical protein
MELKLLTPPSDSPFRIQPTRSLPSEASFAVDTGALPRSLPQQMLDPNYGTQPLDALARLGATGVQVSTQVGNLLAEAEARKRNANNMAQAEILYSAAADTVDKKFTALQGTETHETFRKAYDEMFTQTWNQAMEAAPNDQVRDALVMKLGQFRVTKGAQAGKVDIAKHESFQLGMLDQETHNYVDRATDQTLPPAERDLAKKDLVRLHQNVATTGWVPADKLVGHLEKSLETIGQRNAYGAMTTDPEGFFKGKWEEFRNQMPLDDLVKLRETARTVYYGRLSDEANRVAANDKDFAKHEQERMVTESTGLEARLQGISGKPPSDAELEEHIRRYQYVRTPKETEYWMERRAKLLRDGPVNPVAFAERRYDLYTGKATMGSIQSDRVERRMSTGELDELGKIASDLTDRAKLPNYEAGKRQVTERLGLTMLDWLAGQVPMFRPADQAKLRSIMADALAEYEMRLPNFKGDPVMLGQEIGKRWYDTHAAPIIGGMVQGIDKPVPPAGTPEKRAATPGEGVSQLWNQLMDSAKRQLGIK